MAPQQSQSWHVVAAPTQHTEPPLSPRLLSSTSSSISLVTTLRSARLLHPPVRLCACLPTRPLTSSLRSPARPPVFSICLPAGLPVRLLCWPVSSIPQLRPWRGASLPFQLCEHTVVWLLDWRRARGNRQRVWQQAEEHKMLFMWFVIKMGQTGRMRPMLRLLKTAMQGRFLLWLCPCSHRRGLLWGT